MKVIGSKCAVGWGIYNAVQPWNDFDKRRPSRVNPRFAGEDDMGCGSYCVRADKPARSQKRFALARHVDLQEGVGSPRVQSCFGDLSLRRSGFPCLQLEFSRAIRKFGYASQPPLRFGLGRRQTVTLNCLVPIWMRGVTVTDPRTRWMSQKLRGSV